MPKIDFEKKSGEIRDTILNKIKDFNRIYRNGPDLYFYKRALAVNRQADKLDDFINNDYNLEVLYATLVAWDMNSRGAKMKYFDDFKENVLQLTNQLNSLWSKRLEEVDDLDEIIHTVSAIYDKLHVMKTGDRLVSNSKLLHFILPHLLMPMDRSNTLVYFYKYTNESKKQYLELLRWSHCMAKSSGIDWAKYLDNQWNSTIPKILDNAIIIRNNRSVKKR